MWPKQQTATSRTTEGGNSYKKLSYRRDTQLSLKAKPSESKTSGLRVSWTKKKTQSPGLGSMPAPVTVNGKSVDPVEEFTYLDSLQSSHSNSRLEHIRRIGHCSQRNEKTGLCLQSE